MDHQRVTCIVTVYRKFDFIFSAIDSVLAQTYPDIELIICDDCSGNFPQTEIVQHIEANKRDNLKRWLVYSNPQNLGTVRNFNTAIKKASGFYFINLASDDTFFDKTVMEQVVCAFQETGARIANCRAVFCAAGKRDGMSFQTERDIWELQNMSAIQLFNRISRDNIVTGAATYFTREALEKYGYYNERYCYIEDLPRFLAVYRQGDRIVFFDFPTVYWRRDGVSGSGVKSNRYLEDNLSICRNEILAYRTLLSPLSYRYNRCREATLVYRLEHGGRIPLSKQILLAFRFPDIVLYRLFTLFCKRFERRKRIE